jgi:hypothetical protein
MRAEAGVVATARLNLRTKTAENRRDVGRTDPKAPGLNSRPYWPGGASHDAGRSRVSVRRSLQAVSGFVIRQRPRFSSRAVIPSPRLSDRRCPRARLCGPSSVRTANWRHPTSRRPSSTVCGPCAGPRDNPSDVDWGRERENAPRCDDTGQTAGLRKYQSFRYRLANRPKRPFADLQVFSMNGTTARRSGRCPARAEQLRTSSTGRRAKSQGKRWSPILEANRARL